MKFIAVFCSAYNLDEKYTKPAEKFANLLAKKGYHLVWGGTDEGLMKIIASKVKKGGGKLIGISLEVYRHKARKDADEMVIYKTLGERKAAMLERSDAIVCLVGGVGTLDEVTEIIELRKQGRHKKPIIILNTENFYEGLKVQFQKMRDEGFIPMPLEDLFKFADNPEEAVEYLNKELS